MPLGTYRQKQGEALTSHFGKTIYLSALDISMYCHGSKQQNSLTIFWIFVSLIPESLFQTQHWNICCTGSDYLSNKC